MAFEPSFRGGVQLAIGDVTGSGHDDVIVAAGAGGGPRVRVFDGITGAIISDFFALDRNFRGGVTIAAADYLHLGHAQIAVGAGVGGGPQVRVFDAWGHSVNGPLSSFFAFDPAQRGGVNVGGSARAGSVGGTGVPDLVVGTGPGAVGEVKVFRGDGAVLRDLLKPFGPDYRGGVVTSAAYIEDSPYASIVAGMQFADGGPAQVKVFSGTSGLPIGSYTPFPESPSHHSGLSVAATNDPIMTQAYMSSEFGPAVKGQSVAFRVTVVKQAGYPTPTGTVTFTDAVGGGLLGTGTLVAGADGNAYTGIVTTTLKISPNGEGVSATYNGDSVYMGGGGPTNYVSLSPGLLPEPCEVCSRQTTEAAGATQGPGGVKMVGGARTDGSIRVTRTDLAGQTGNVPGGQQWSWGTNSAGADGLAGAGAMTGTGLSLYQVMPGGGTSGNGACLALLDGGNPAVFLDKYYTNWANPETPTFHARYQKPYTVTEDATNHLITVQDGSGSTFVFWDFSSGNASAGPAGSSRRPRRAGPRRRSRAIPRPGPRPRPRRRWGAGRRR